MHIIHTPTQNVTTTPTTDNTTAHHKQTTAHPLTNNKRTKHRHTSSQHKLNQKQNRGIKKTRTQHPTGHRHNTRNKTHTESKNTQNTHTTSPYAQTESTNKEGGGAHHTAQGRHNLHKHKHTPKAINTHNTELQLIKIHIGKTRHHSSKHILSTKRHHVTTLQHRGNRYRILHTTRHQHTRLNTHR